MRIKKILIKNFRSIREETIEFDNLTVLVGKNGAGKSSFLQAIRYFFEPNKKLEVEDFYNRTINGNTVETKMTFCNLTKEETEAFKKYTRRGTLTVNKVYKGDSKGIYYGYTKQIPEFKEILDSNLQKVQMRNKFNELLSLEKFKNLEKATSYDNMKDIMENWIEKHPEQCNILPVGTEFYGFTGQYCLDNFTKCVFIPAVKEAEEEIDKGSLKELMDVIVLRKISDNEEVKKFNESFQERAEDIFKIENFPELEGLSSELSKTLDIFSPGSAIDIEWDEIKAPNLPTPSYIAEVIEDGFKGDPTRKGHGLQRALIITLFQHLKKTKPAESSGNSGSNHEESTNPRLDLLFLIEEPELYLHPHRARYLSKVFLELTNEGEESGQNQIIYSTHSPFFVGLDRFEHIRLIQKIEPNQIGLPKISTCTSCSYEKWVEGLKQTCEIPESVDPKSTFLYRCRPVINSIVNEGLFANVVLVVEGLTEVGIFQKLAEMLGNNWDEKGIVVVPGSGKNNLDRIVVIFEGFKIPTYFVFDADADVEEQKDKNGDKNIKLQKYLGGYENPNPFPESFATDKFAVFHTKIEDYLKEVLGNSDFFSIRDVIAKNFGILNKEKLDSLLKNVECAADFIEEVYRKDFSIPVLEDIINYTTKLLDNRFGEG